MPVGADGTVRPRGVPTVVLAIPSVHYVEQLSNSPGSAIRRGVSSFNREKGEEKVVVFQMAARSRGYVRRATVLAACLVSLAAGLVTLGGAASASASNELFCTFANLPVETGCADSTFRLITRVNVLSINFAACAGAHNSNGVEIGGWACTVEAGEASNGNYEGNKQLKGYVWNASSKEQTIGHGQEWW
jgi:hypothetical protein